MRGLHFDLISHIASSATPWHYVLSFSYIQYTLLKNVHSHIFKHYSSLWQISCCFVWHIGWFLCAYFAWLLIHAVTSQTETLQLGLNLNLAVWVLSPYCLDVVSCFEFRWFLFGFLSHQHQILSFLNLVIIPFSWIWSYCKKKNKQKKNTQIHTTTGI